jgi:hypothetical protein
VTRNRCRRYSQKSGVPVVRARRSATQPGIPFNADVLERLDEVVVDAAQGIDLQAARRDPALEQPGRSLLVSAA